MLKGIVRTLLVALALGTLSAAQNSTSNQSSTAAVQARESDVDTIEHILAATYDTISGPAGSRDWDRFRSLFYEGARLIPSRRDASGKVGASSRTVEEYITAASGFLAKEGFFENSISNRVESWDHFAHVWSTYESRHAKGEKPFTRGINSFQLMNDGKRWWVITIYWEGEDTEHPIPERYLKHP
ncbi:MAG TPA: hypothetical protein VKZ53_22525 [Candidatus Angelobacter sp.]|nr:hypothetical protein [Candidatus Angelobacter sp.]